MFRVFLCKFHIFNFPWCTILISLFLSIDLEMARLPDAIKDDSPVQLTVSTIVELPYTFDEKYSNDMSGSSPNSKNFIIYVFTVQFNTLSKPNP